MRPRRKLFASVVAAALSVAPALGEPSGDPIPPKDPVPPNEAPIVAIFASAGTKTPIIWGEVEYLLWWVKPQSISAPLVTTGNPNDAVPGAIGQPGTRVLFGGNNLNYGATSGLRVNFGAWLNDDATIGFETSWFQLEQRSTHFGIASDGTGNPPIYMPTINQDPASGNFGGRGSITIADPLFPPPGPTVGRLSVDSTSRLWGAEANALMNLGRSCAWSVDGLAGFHYADLAERLRINGFSNEAGIDIRQSFFDDFSASNHFYGGQLGTRVGYEGEQFFLKMTAKAALGSTHQVVGVQGQSLYSGTGFSLPAGLYPGGIYAQPSNIGSREADRLTFIPQVQIQAGVKITSQLKATIGYDFLYWSSVVRPGQQIDPNLNPNQFPGLPFLGARLPGPQFNRTDFYAQGLKFGLLYEF